MLKRCAVGLSAIVLSLGVLAVAPVAAWEEDVHYVLTFWLATQAGFARNDADQIGQGDQSYDDSEHAAAIQTVLWIILREDMGAARELQLKHFPSDAALPSPPLRRVVSPNSPSARKAAEAAIATGNAGAALMALGEGLHPFQDSWSHQGVPDIPFNMRPNMISAHPAARGGWLSHDADLTHLHVDDTLAMARETYQVLTRFLDRNPSFRRRPAVPWATLEARVRAFAVAGTREAKGVWAAREVPEASNNDRVRGAVQSGSSLRMRALSPPLTSQRDNQPALDPADRALLVRTVNEFLRSWLAQRDVDAAMRHVDLAAMAAQFSGDPRLASRAAVDTWSGKFLTLQLIDDHDAANRAGHGDPGHPRYTELPARPVANGEFRATRRSDPPTVGARELIFTNVLAEPAFAVVLQNDSALRDALTLVWHKSDGRWSVARLFSVAD